MIQKKTVLLFIFVGLFAFSCSKKGTELEIEKEATAEKSETVEKVVTEEDEKKPLIIVKPEDTVKIFVRSDGAPGMYLGEDGEVHGFYVDLEKMVMEEMGQNYEFVPYDDVGPVAIALKAGTHHIGLSVPDLPDYRSFLNLSIPYEYLNFVVFVQDSNEEISGDSFDDTIKSLSGKKVGVQTQGHIFQLLREFKEIELVEYPTTTQAMEDLDKGMIDAVPDVKRIGKYYAELNSWKVKPVGKPLFTQLITTATSQALDPGFLERYNVALKAIIDDGRRDELYISYFGPIEEGDLP